VSGERCRTNEETRRGPRHQESDLLMPSSSLSHGRPSESDLTSVLRRAPLSAEPEKRKAEKFEDDAKQFNMGKDVADEWRRVAAVGTIKTIKDRRSKLDEIASIVTARQTFQELVRVLLKDSGRPSPRLIIFIDDLDRALPEQVADVFKNLKLILESPRCVFVL